MTGFDNSNQPGPDENWTLKTSELPSENLASPNRDHAARFANEFTSATDRVGETPDDFGAGLTGANKGRESIRSQALRSAKHAGRYAQQELKTRPKTAIAAVIGTLVAAMGIRAINRRSAPIRK